MCKLIDEKLKQFANARIGTVKMTMASCVAVHYFRERTNGVYE